MDGWIPFSWGLARLLIPLNRIQARSCTVPYCTLVSGVPRGDVGQRMRFGRNKEMDVDVEKANECEISSECEPVLLFFAWFGNVVKGVVG
jgi:hypothetical protein